VKGEVFYLTNSIDNQKLNIVSAFEEWYAVTFEEEEQLTQNVRI